jgi:glycosyltransferase involved in cell wall biosynthesis
MRRLLVLNFFPAFHPPRSGGEERYHHLYASLSRFFDVTLVSPTYPDHPHEVVRFGPHLREHRVPKNVLHLRLHHALDEENIGPECSGLVCALASADEDDYRREVRRLLPEADAVVHEFPYMLGYDEGFGRDGRPRIYNSHNLEASLAAHMFRRPQGDKYVRFVTELEARLVAGSDLVFSTSESERQGFHELYLCPLEKIALAPNGFQPREEGESDALPSADARRTLDLPEAGPLAIFLGSAHPPNREAASFICDRLAAVLPGMRFALAGSVCAAISSAPPNVSLLGVLSDRQKALLFRACDVALNPVTSGAGTNLKLLDYFAAGLAVVTTDFGARGLPIEDDRHCVVSSVESFDETVRALAGDAQRRARLGAAAAELARARYSWPAIAEDVRRAVDDLLGRRPAARRPHCPRLLLLNDFPVSAAEHGGQVRLFQLFSNLSRHFEVTLLCPSDDLFPIEVRIGDRFTELRVPRTQDHRRMQAEWNARHPAVSTADILDAVVCRDNAELVAHYRRLLRDADAVVLAHPYLAPLLDAEPPDVPVVYEALNVEVGLKSSILAEHPDRDRLLPIVAEVEALACARARRVVCVSRQDEEQFARRVAAEKIAVVANGVDVGAYENGADLGEARALLRGRPVAVFLGSGHPPNVEAVRFILERLAPENPDVLFLVVGTAGDAVRHHPRPANVLLCGAVSAAEKVRLLQLADVAINPMRSGGGSSLKVADYLAAGLPLLSTPIGLRGFEIAPGEDAVAADLDSFSTALGSLVASPEERARLGEGGRRYAREHSDWKSLAERYRRVLEAVISERPVRLLVSTFRFTDPPLGGAETYLFRVLEQLARQGRFVIDVATFDVRGIANFAHFAARYEPGPHATPAFVRHVHGFAVEEPAEGELMESCRKLFTLWQREELPLARRFAARLGEAVLLGGWYPVELYGERALRWTGARAEILCPRGCRRIVLHGQAPSATPLRVSREGRTLHEGTVSGSFTLHLDLGETAPGIVAIDAETAYRGRHDARRLGVCVTRITAGDGRSERDLALAEDYATHLRKTDAAAWIGALIETTEGRAPDDGAPFQLSRGPHSRRFEEWLGDRIRSYDLVLAHGIPFSHAVVAGEAARAAGVPYAVLPHYHMDDRYYHWQRYYELFRGAALVLAFPDRSLPLFFDRIGARAVAVAGGGVDPDEFADLAAARRAFRAVHDSPRPFVLVLGRKEANKGYHRVIAAVDRLRARGADCEVVLIGPDSDSLPIESTAARYYGRQPREVVLGALAECACLATMSESESFGIVIVEAWTCGKPVIANRDCPAFAELVDDGHDGFLCGSEEEIAAALARLLADPQLGARLAAAGKSKALERYTWQGMAAAIGEALLEAVHHSSTSTNTGTNTNTSTDTAWPD